MLCVHVELRPGLPQVSEGPEAAALACSRLECCLLGTSSHVLRARFHALPHLWRGWCIYPARSDAQLTV